MEYRTSTNIKINNARRLRRYRIYAKQWQTSLPYVRKVSSMGYMGYYNILYFIFNSYIMLVTLLIFSYLLLAILSVDKIKYFIASIEATYGLYLLKYPQVVTFLFVLCIIVVIIFMIPVKGFG